MFFYKKNFFYSHGKLLLTGEYLILLGSIGLALPTIKGQSLSVFETKNKSSILYWKSYDINLKKAWFEVIFELPYLKIVYETEKNISYRLKNLLLKSKKIEKRFLEKKINIYVNTFLQFSRKWGLGSSSTLINNIAQWAGINPYKLLGKDFPGSGYDLACVSNAKSIIFKLKKNIPYFLSVEFNPPFKNKLYFLYLNKKQNTTDGINWFFSKKKYISKNIINTISYITLKILSCNKLKEFEELLLKHEMIISKILNLPTVKELYFPDYLGLVKSLGTWGGDFALISFRKGMKNYFLKKGFHTIISFEKMILKNF
ncbi:GYDIA family GHMP kinase [Blattabacterium cuenoti]|uniref:GYDIA family GHMP kinase n=1 Tax=Blattabacterium cuenoti TaxID=1653831 RepID=UPI00163C2219|nr:GYDIA family GHMP kinase [Blattabacterium cuenoti]